MNKYFCYPNFMIQTIDRFQPALPTKLPVIAAALFYFFLIGSGTAYASGCYYEIPEGCTPAIIFWTDPGSPVCASSVTGYAYTSCNTEGDAVYEIGNSESLGLNGGDSSQYEWSGSISLVKGMNRLTAESCELQMDSDEVDVASNGGSGPSLAWSGTPISIVKCHKWGFDSALQVCCLPQSQATTGTPANGPYSIQESVTATSGCTSIQSVTVNPNPQYSGTDSSGCLPPLPDTNEATPPGYLNFNTFSSACNCSVSLSQTITVTGPSFTQYFYDSGVVSYGACPSGTSAIMTLSGDAIGGSVATTNTVWCDN